MAVQQGLQLDVEAQPPTKGSDGSCELLMEPADSDPSQTPNAPEVARLGLRSYACALLGASPLLAVVAIKLEHASLPYFALHLACGPAALKLRDAGTPFRWVAALVLVALLGGIKTNVFLTRLRDDSLVTKCLLYAATALWETSNAALVIGGRTMQEKTGVVDYGRSIVAVSCPSQVKFLVGATAQAHRFGVRTFHIGAYLVVGYLCRLLFGTCVDTVQAVPLFEAEALVILTSCYIMFLNLPAHWWQLCMLQSSAQVVYPYGTLYTSASMREFWSRWSRPATQLIRHLVFHPLGGKDRVWLSIPVLFALNAVSHYDVSNALIGDRAELGWNIVFGTLAVASLFEVMFDRCGFAQRLVYRICRRTVSGIAVRVAAYFLLHQCLHLSISSMVSPSISLFPGVVNLGELYEFLRPLSATARDPYSATQRLLTYTIFSFLYPH